MDAREQAGYDSLIDAMVAKAMGGSRIYYSEPSFEYNQQLNKQVCTIFKIKSRLSQENIWDLKEFDGGNKPKFGEPGFLEKPTQAANERSDEYCANHFCDLIKHLTLSNLGVKLIDRVDHFWPASPFDEWLDEEHAQHWMTAETFTDPDVMFGDFALMITVYAPVEGDLEEYKARYGQAFIMTKLGMDLEQHDDSE